MQGILFVIFIFSFFIFHLSGVIAQTMSNSSYKIFQGNLNMAGGSPSGSSNKLRFTAGQISPGLYTGANYKVRSGFQYIKTSIAFGFSISPTLLDFGIVSPNNPITRTNTLTVSNGATLGYSVTVSADRQPTSKEGSVIPGTSCDDGTCNDSKASIWTSSLSYGFGYRCDNLSGKDCDSSFLENYFKSLSISPSLQTIMSGGRGRDKKAQVSYKVNISPTQQAGTYTNNITFIAAPSF